MIEVSSGARRVDISSVASKVDIKALVHVFFKNTHSPVRAGVTIDKHDGEARLTWEHTRQNIL